MASFKPGQAVLRRFFVGKTEYVWEQVPYSDRDVCRNLSTNEVSYTSPVEGWDRRDYYIRDYNGTVVFLRKIGETAEE